LLKKSEKTSESVIPAKAGIQHITDFNHYNILDPGFRRGDDEFFINLLMPSDVLAVQYILF
jgi:hypothetical protein